MAHQAHQIIEQEMSSRKDRIPHEIVDLLEAHGFKVNLDWRMLWFPDRSLLSVGLDGHVTAQGPISVKMR